MVRDAAGMRADLVVVEQADLGPRGMRVLVVEVERLRDARERGGRHRQEQQELDEPDAHVNPL